LIASPERLDKPLASIFAIKQDYTIVFVTHTLRQARRLADYVVFL